MTSENRRVKRVELRTLADGRMRPTPAAIYLGMTEKTLSMWRSAGRGPRYVKVGGRVFYFVHDLDRFIAGEANAA
jgi:hypothetical protein